MPPVPAIDVSQLRQRLAGEPAPFLLDVREPWEYRQGHVPGAQLIPLGELEQRVNEVPRDRPVLVDLDGPDPAWLVSDATIVELGHGRDVFVPVRRVIRNGRG